MAKSLLIGLFIIFITILMLSYDVKYEVAVSMP